MSVLSFRAVIKPTIDIDETHNKEVPLVIYGVTVFGDGECCVMYDDLADAMSKQLDEKEGNLLLEQLENNFSINEDCIYLDGAKVQQDTGLLDITGTPIFEGDIVRCPTRHGGPWIGVIEWADWYAAWRGNFTIWNNSLGELYKKITVIGNIALTPNIERGKWPYTKQEAAK